MSRGQAIHKSEDRDQFGPKPSPSGASAGNKDIKSAFLPAGIITALQGLPAISLKLEDRIFILAKLFLVEKPLHVSTLPTMCPSRILSVRTELDDHKESVQSKQLPDLLGAVSSGGKYVKKAL